ncbi:sigma-70 family RNA polymerase sigma factor [Nocardia puris]|uniref:RNA polymerase ECF family sigma subunit n=1 Tax=Nocardia puris TaxID=208602 RepID=A0A366DDB1_9NOCA|nr:sigma-70 family RNA polymerase sigma factor [Nocardia puris]MBF6211859.1 sigma-70 family RNA polymerase sigma factor [Nocardia puris]MBF6365862.1 sigma-70 family RNA polymerase sigma factor [Nocardia puris]MBF6460495.1 sigma-70 family RNA polymerase sigma factor [Nocardia puris]RBO87499.1 RNA polymerase ECF family sigma subunit [Nocardia puris]
MTESSGPAATLSPDVLASFEGHRRELCAYAYRMLGSSFEAEDAVQETFTRAWKSYDSFEGRASLRSWLYRIATNVCLDMLDGPQRRARPMDLNGPYRPDAPLPPPQPDYVWIEPIPNSLAFGADPAEHATIKDTLRLAFVAACQHLPATQRAILIMREVLRFSASETAEALMMSPASVNSALQRARATMSKIKPTDSDGYDETDENQRKLIDDFVTAFESYDMDALTSLLKADVALSMPPLELWVSGPENVAAFMLGHGAACRNSRMIRLEGANGLPAFGHYKPTDEPGVYSPWSITVLELEGKTITGLNFFLDTEKLFPLFDLPMELRDPA